MRKKMLTAALTEPLTDLAPPLIKDWAKIARITTKTKLPPMRPAVIIQDTWVCTEGEIMQVSGQKKAGKSNVLKYLIATALMPEVDTQHTLGIRATYTKNDVVFIDTEQSLQKTQEFIIRVCEIAGYTTDPPNLFFYNIRGNDMKERLEFLTEFLFKQHPKASLIVIDGITDFIDSVNNEEVSKTLIDSLLKRLGGSLSIVVTIHEGKDGNGARGHIGQEIERKCVGAISVSKDRKTRTHKISCKLVRNSADFDDIIFAYDSSLKDFRLLDASEIKATEKKRLEEKIADLRSTFEQIFATSSQLPPADVVNGILLYDNSINKSALLDSQKTAARRILKRAADLELITKNNEGYYLLND